VSKDGSTRRAVQLGSNGTIHSLVVDGVDLSMGMRSAVLTLAAGELPTLVLDPLVTTLDGAELEHARVVVTDHAAAALIVLGWTPPEETA
jgi:hypothetical protein